MLYSLVALAYLKRLAPSQISSARLSLQQFRCLLSFDLQAASLQSSSDNDDVSDLLEHLWENHCSNLGFQVSSAVRFQRVFWAKDAINTPPLGPSRAPATKLLDYIEFQGKDHGGTSKRPREEDSRSSAKKAKYERLAVASVVPKFFDIITMITASKYFVSLPSRSTGLARCKLLQCIDHWLRLDPSLSYQLLLLKEDVTHVYENIVHNGRAWEMIDGEYHLVPLTIAEARKVLRALDCNHLIRHLLVERGARSFLMSPEMVVTDGCERARLFLARMDLPVCCNLPLDAQLCTEEARAVLECQALSEFLLFWPSAIDKMLRQMTLELMWTAEGASILNLRPEDYVSAGAPQNSRAWKVVQKLRYPILINSSLEEAFCLLLSNTVQKLDGFKAHGYKVPAGVVALLRREAGDQVWPTGECVLNKVKEKTG